MIPSRSSLARLRLARHRFIEGGEVPPGLVTPALLRSWERSRRAGLTPQGLRQEGPRLAAPELRQALERRADFLAHARPVMEYLHAQVRSSGSLVILADERGLLLHALGETGFLLRAEKVALAPGASWQEAHRGTNAIGTALAEGAAVEVHGPEHFLERNGFLTCCAAPILDPEGKLLGALDISGDQRGRHPHTQGLVGTAAQMIENRLLLSRHRRGLRLHFHPQVEGIGTLVEGVLVVSADGWVIAANRVARTLLALAPGDMGATPLQRIFAVRFELLMDWGRRRGSQPLPVEGPGGIRYYVQVQGEGDSLIAVGAPTASVEAGVPRVTGSAQDELARLNTGDGRMERAIARVRRILGKPIPLLITGESGVGKELFARAVHGAGPRAQAPWVALNCAALPESLIESELFGYTPGAYTGARRDGNPGRLREAHGGTLFLDEIGDMPLSLQARLLRVLQEREVVPLGGGKAVAVDFALICATHRDLRAEVEAGRFRADLYYRLNGLTVSLPALREREDLLALVYKLLAEQDRAMAGHGEWSRIRLTPELERAFVAYGWPGNLRQLSNVLRTAVAFLEPGETWIDRQHLPEDLLDDLAPWLAAAEGGAPPLSVVTPLGQGMGQGIDPGAGSAPQGSLPPPQTLHGLSELAVDRAIEAAGGNMSEAARRLGISRNTLYRRLARRKLAGGQGAQ